MDISIPIIFIGNTDKTYQIYTYVLQDLFRILICDHGYAENKRYNHEFNT